MIPLAVLEGVIDASGIAPLIEAMLPIGVRARQLLVRTLLLGMLLVLADQRPAHLTRVHQALTSLPEDDQRRLGVLADWKQGPHQLTYRQTERTFGLVTAALGKDNLLRSEDELFYGYYLSTAIMTRDEHGPAVPELARRATVSSPRHDPVRAFAPVLTALPGQGIPLGDILDDSGYATATPMPGHCRCAPPARSSSRTCTRTTAGPRAPTTAPS